MLFCFMICFPFMYLLLNPHVATYVLTANSKYLQHQCFLVFSIGNSFMYRLPNPYVAIDMFVYKHILKSSKIVCIC